MPLLFTAHNSSCGKVMFSQVSVILFVGRGASHASWNRSHGRSTSLWTPDLGYPLSLLHLEIRPAQTCSLKALPLLVIPRDQHWRHVQTWSLEALPCPHCYWHLVVATETCIVGKWEVHILVECFLVLCVISLHTHSVSETTVMHKQVSGWTVNFGPNFPDYKVYSEIPPLQKTSDLRFEMTKVYSEIPPLQKTSHLRWPKFTPKYPPAPENWNLGRSWHFVTFQFQNTPPPQNWNLGRSWHFVTFQFQNTPPPKIEI